MSTHVQPAPLVGRWDDPEAALRRADRAEWRRQVKHIERAIAYRQEEIARMQRQLDAMLEAGPPPLKERK